MGKAAKIEKIWAREVLNFRGNPAVEAEVFLTDGSYGKAAGPAGISTGSSEAIQIFDGDPARFGGKGVLRAVKNVRKVIAPALQGLGAGPQEKIDEALLRLDGTPDKRRLGANAILGSPWLRPTPSRPAGRDPFSVISEAKAPFAFPSRSMTCLRAGPMLKARWIFRNIW